MRHKTKLVVDLDLLAGNFDLLKSLCPLNTVIFVVKANAYGHGLVPIVRFALEELKVAEFGVATLGEASYLRRKLGHLDFKIYVFSDTNLDFQSCEEAYLDQNIIPVVSNKTDLDFLLKNRDFFDLPLCLKFNTGMNRLGLPVESVEEVVEALKKSGRTRINHLMSQFGCASLPITDGGPCAKQYNRFMEVKDFFKSSGVEVEGSSMANSGAIEQGFALNETHVRPGLILYGPSSLNKSCLELSRWKGRNISQLETYIINSFVVEKGQAVGYGGIKAPDDGVVAMIALGYGDGFSDRIMGTTLRHKGHLGTILGRVNMDMTQVFFPTADLTLFAEKEKFIIWGHDPQDLLNYSCEGQVQMIPYEKFCHLTQRIPRIYVRCS